MSPRASQTRRRDQTGPTRAANWFGSARCPGTMMTRTPEATASDDGILWSVGPSRQAFVAALSGPVCDLVRVVVDGGVAYLALAPCLVWTRRRRALRPSGNSLSVRSWRSGAGASGSAGSGPDELDKTALGGIRRWSLVSCYGAHDKRTPLRSPRNTVRLA